MARSTANKLYRTFVGGLITEASPLTYPENASIDEDNCIIFRKGNRTRRLGVEYEDGYALSAHALPSAQVADGGLKEFTWTAVNNNANINFLVQQVGDQVYFYDMSPAAPSANRKSFSINLDDYKAPTFSSVTQTA